jgi:hypothetical protein
MWQELHQVSARRFPATTSPILRGQGREEAARMAAVVGATRDRVRWAIRHRIWLFGDPKFLGEFGRRTVRHLLILINLRGCYTVPAENPVQRWKRAEARHHRIVS